MSAIPSHIQFAGFGRRAVAYVLDNFLASFISVIVMQMIAAEEMQVWAEQYVESVQSGEVIMLPASLIAIHILTFAVYSCYCWLKFQGTPGQRLLKMKVLNVKTGNALSINQVCLRFVVLYGVTIIAGPFAPLVLGLSMLNNPHQRALHDLIASSVVVLQDSMGNAAEAGEQTNEQRQTDDDDDQDNRTF